MRQRTTSWVAAIAWVVLVAAGSACSASGAESTPPTRIDADVTITSRDMAFDQKILTVAAGSVWRLQLVNKDSAPHNVAIYRDQSTTETVFVGKPISSATIVYDVRALEPGTYFFRCDVHPQMNGTLIVRG